ncbi:aquaporin-10-like isoform X2 [Pristis pectinata]|uniref:aquaporin-10-like isoform X2 n=1 Tax=Pristis pectinata TaxID=685728 RepID=UPI00223DDE69|nr:aquaporin-10-like isoform X2 [Pristis pectinata]
MSQVDVAMEDRASTPVQRALDKAATGVKAFRRHLRVKNELLRQCLAEFLGEYILILMGSATVAQVITNYDRKGTYLSINMGYAIGVLFGIYMSSGVSGAHLNPAVTLSLCALGRFPWQKMPFYTLAECLGSFVAAATTYALYYDSIHEFSNGSLTVLGPRGTAGIFATYPAEHITTRNGFITEVIATGVLLICILAIGDSRNAMLPDFLRPLVTSICVLTIGMGMGANTGYAINPARDIGPRMFTFVAGWGSEVFTLQNQNPVCYHRHMYSSTAAVQCKA